MGQCRDLFLVADVVSRPLAAGLQQFYTHRRFITTVVTAAVIDKRHRSAYLSLVKVQVGRQVRRCAYSPMLDAQERSQPSQGQLTAFKYVPVFRCSRLVSSVGTRPASN